MLLSFDRDWRVVGVSDDWLSVLGYARDEVIGRHILDFVTAESRRMALAESLPRLGRLGRLGVTRDLPQQLVKKNGEIMEVLISAVAEESDGRFLSVVVDITERKRAAEATRQAKEEAVRANSAKSKFLAAASHDLRQPVQALRFLVGALGRAGDPDHRDALVTEMNGALEGMSGILDALLDISQLDSGHVKPKTGAFPINDVLLRYQSRPTRAQEVRVVPCSGTVQSDPRLLGRIVDNFVSNAERYSDHGRILIGCRRAGENLRIEVWDDGIGIADDQLDAVFEEFYQVGNEARDRRQGLGLGLAISKRVASILGHAIELRSVPDNGSMFAVAVPLAAAAKGARGEVVPTSPAADPPMSATIVAIEDDAAVLGALRWLLESLGHGVLAAASCDEALGMIAATQSVPDLIIADYRLAHGDTGSQAIARIRLTLNADVPGLILTGDTAIGSPQGDLMTLHKPISVADMHAAIGSLIRPRRSGSER